MPTLTYNRANSVIIKNVIMLNIIHNIFNLLDTEVVVCIILVILNSWFINIAESGDNHQQSIWLFDLNDPKYFEN
jgi:lipoprotein signal peptidase